MAMNKSEYLNILRKQLNHLTQEEKDEVIFDYEEHFRYGLKDGKSEDTIASDLGHPKEIAKQYNAKICLQHAEASASVLNIIRAVITIAGIGFINAIFVPIPFIVITTVLLALFASGIGAVITGVVLFVGRLLMPFFPTLIHLDMSFFMVVFASMFMISAGLFLTVGVAGLSKYIYTAIVRYLRFSIKIINN